jgi:hypothetical protein
MWQLNALTGLVRTHQNTVSHPRGDRARDSHTPHDNCPVKRPRTPRSEDPPDRERLAAGVYRGHLGVVVMGARDTGYRIGFGMHSSRKR